jgi:hypothetical protein
MLAATPSGMRTLMDPTPLSILTFVKPALAGNVTCASLAPVDSRKSLTFNTVRSIRVSLAPLLTFKEIGI